MHARRTVLMAGVAAALARPVHATEKVKIRSTGIVDHPVIEAIREGILEGLAASGFPAGAIDFRYQSAQGNAGVAAQIAKTFVGERPAVIIPISTPSSQAVVQAAEGRVPVVFASSTDPIAAGLVTSLTSPGANVTGVSDMVDPGVQIEYVRKILPNANRIGIISNPGEVNSVVLLRLARQAAGKQGFTLVERDAVKSADVQQAARTLVGQVDALYLPASNTIVSALASVLLVGEQHRLPVFAADDKSVAAGAVATLGFDYTDIGRLAGRMAAEVLRGRAPGTMPVAFMTQLEPVINRSAAARMGVTIPESMLAGARLVGPK